MVAVFTGVRWCRMVVLICVALNTHPLLCLHVCSLPQHVWSCSTDGFTCNIFLDSIYMCVNPRYLLFYPTYFILYDNSRPIHIPTGDPVLFHFTAEQYSIVYVLHLCFNWRIIGFQCCVGFCPTSAWVGCKYACSLPSRASISPLWVSTERRAELPLLHSSFPPAVHRTPGGLSISLFFQFTPPASSPAVSTNLFSVCVTVPALQVGSSVLLFLIPNIC